MAHEIYVKEKTRL